MKSKDLINEARQKFSASFMQAIKDGNEEGMAESIAELSQNIQDALMQEANDTSADQAVLAARGVRVLTSEETKYYEKLITAMESANNVKAAVTNLDVAMPETIIDAVLDDIESAFPILDEIDFRNTTAITKWFYNKQGVQQAAWGALDTKITQELSGAIGEISLTQCKLTGYMVVSKDFLRLGPTWLDAYVRAILSEANGVALETAVVDGDGNNCPIGMTRDLTKGSTTEGKTTYTRKTATKVTKLDPATYGSILAKLAKTPSGRQRNIQNVIMVVNPADYMEKVMPATTILTPQGTYVSDVLPFPTKVIQSVGMPTGHAAVGLGKRYFLGLGSSKEGLIDYSDHAQFLDDNRVYTTHLYGNGTPLDNNAFEYLDISGLEALSYVSNTSTTTE
jgi:HK97 family phage major capsid protein